MEGKGLKRFLIITACCLVFLPVAGALLGLFFLIGPGIPLHAEWEGNRVEVARVSGRKPYVLCLSGVEISSPGFIARIPRMELIFRPFPPFFKGISMDRPRIQIEAAGEPSGKQVRISSEQYRLLRLLHIRDGEVRYSSPDLHLELRELSLAPLKRPGHSGDEGGGDGYLSVRYRAGTEGVDVLGRLVGRLDFSSLDLKLDSTAELHGPGLSCALPFRLRVELPLPEDLGAVKTNFSMDVPGIEAILQAKEAGMEGPVSINGTVSFSQKRGLDARGKIGLPLERVLHELSLPLNHGDVQAFAIKSPGDFSRISLAIMPEIKGRSSTRLRLDYEPSGGSWHLSSDISLKGLSGSRDPDHAFEDLDLGIRLHIHGSGTDISDLAWNVEMSWTRGQVLMYPWFLDLSNLKGHLSARGRISKKGIIVSSLDLKGPVRLRAGDVFIPLERAGAGTARGLFEGIRIGSLDLSGRLERLYPVLVKDPFSDSHPVLAMFAPSGSIYLRTMGKVLSLGCRADIDYSGSPLFRGLILDFQWPFKAKDCRSGGLSWKDFYLQNLLPTSFLDSHVKVRLKQRQIPMIVCRDRISAGPVSLDLQHGEISLERAGMDLPGGNLEFQGICLKDLEIKKLIRDFPYEMTVTARDMSAKLTGGRLVFSGSIKAQVAGGSITASNIWLEPLAPIVRYGADIVFEGLDLKQLTRPTSFGVISGVVSGRIKGLVMSGIQPERFEFLLETDKASNAPRKISIKAVENLSILGGGEGSVSFLGYFFKKFSYRRMGISCSLKNDVFILHGLIRKDGKEYLVERGFFGGVNVINMNPGGRIRFKDMVERLKRITETDNSKMEVR